jgi:hypothetical protein
VERGLDSAAVGPLPHLLPVHLDLYDGDAPSDDLTVEGRWVRAEQDRPDAVARPVLQAVRGWLAESESSLARRRVQGRVRLGEGRVETTGGSVGLALAVQVVATLHQVTERRVRLAPAEALALTGGVEETGAVQSVAEDTLPAKVEACFFSPVETLAVPRAQQERAEQKRDRLLDHYPHGGLDVVGVRRLRDVFDHRRLVRRVESSRVRHFARRAWRRKGPVASTLLIVALLLGLAWTLYGPLDKNPVSVTFGGSEMQLRNHAGRIVDRITVGTEVVERVQNPGDSYGAYALQDIAGDGRNEVCWAQRVYETPEAPAVVACRAVGAESPLWRTPLQVDFSFPEKPAVQSNAFVPMGLLAGDLDDNGRPEVYVTAKHRPYFPGIVVQYDAVTGEKMQRYIHAGHLNSQPLAVDLDQNGGVQELMIGGTSNAFGQGVFVVLDPRTMDGHGPITAEYRLAEADPAVERADLRCPYTPLGRVQQVTHPMVKRVRYWSASGQIRLEILVGTYGDGREVNRPYVLVHLNDALRPQSIGTSSQYDYLADSLVADGRLEAVPDGDDFARYRDQIRYWTGAGWTTEPTWNERSGTVQLR